MQFNLLGVRFLGPFDAGSGAITPASHINSNKPFKNNGILLDFHRKCAFPRVTSCTNTGAVSAANLYASAYNPRMRSSLTLTTVILALTPACKPEPADPDLTTTATDGLTTSGTTDTAGTTGAPTTTSGDPPIGTTGGTASTGDPTDGNPDSENVVLGDDGCLRICVKDLDPATAMLEPNCEVFDNDPGLQTRVPIVPCMEVAAAWVAPAGEAVCWAGLVDRDGMATQSKIDDIDLDCRDTGANLQIRVIRSVPPVPNAFVDATCELSAETALDCRGL